MYDFNNIFRNNMLVLCVSSRTKRHSNENQTDAEYTDIEMIDQRELSSTESRFKLVHFVINSIRS